MRSTRGGGLSTNLFFSPWDHELRSWWWGGGVNNNSPWDHEVHSWWGGGELIITHHETMSYTRGGVIKLTIICWWHVLPPVVSYKVTTESRTNHYLTNVNVEGAMRQWDHLMGEGASFFFADLTQYFYWNWGHLYKNVKRPWAPRGHFVVLIPAKLNGILCFI